MGLDCCASRVEGQIVLPQEDRAAFEAAGICLTHGLLRMDAGCFRGKLYDTILLDVTHVYVGMPWIPPDKVREMYAALTACDPAKLLEYYEQIADDNDQDYTGEGVEIITEKLQELRKFFKVCVDRNLGLIGDS
jgi:hypothetical protein